MVTKVLRTKKDFSNFAQYDRDHKGPNLEIHKYNILYCIILYSK